MNSSIQNAIAEGDFRRAALLYDELLEADPHNRDYVGGYYASRYWANRQDLVLMEKEGKHRAAFLMQEWEAFEVESARRGLENLTILPVLMAYIFRQAAVNLRQVFLLEGSRSMGVEFLQNLGFCLLRAGDYPNAADVLEYADGQHPRQPKLQFYLAEAYYGLSNPDKSKLLYRECLYRDSSQIDFRLIQADFILDLMREVEAERQPLKESWMDYVFIYGVAAKILDMMLPLTEEQVSHELVQIESLEKEYHRVDPKLRPRMEIHLLKKYLYLMDYFEFQQRDPNAFSRLADRVRDIDDNIYKLYSEHKKHAF